MKRVLRKAFWVTLFWKQNNWHKHGVLVHTLRVAQECYKAKRYDLIIPALLHDVGKPYSAFQDEKDLKLGTYSFTNHEEYSYVIIKNWKFISEKTKLIVRYHYLIRGEQKAREKGLINKANRYARIIKRLDTELLQDIKDFQSLDDLGKK